MVSLLPATATLIGIAVLAQVPAVVDVLGVVLPMAGVALHRELPDGSRGAPKRPSPGAERDRRRSSTLIRLGGRDQPPPTPSDGALGGLR